MARILVAEDDEDLRMLVDLVLTRAGHLVHTVGDGAAALEACLAGGVDLAVLDVMMPCMTGLEVTERVRADPSVSGTRILLLSALSTHEDRHRGRDVGADDYMTKPFDLLCWTSCDASGGSSATTSVRRLTFSTRIAENRGSGRPVRTFLPPVGRFLTFL